MSACRTKQPLPRPVVRGQWPKPEARRSAPYTDHLATSLPQTNLPPAVLKGAQRHAGVVYRALVGRLSTAVPAIGRAITQELRSARYQDLPGTLYDTLTIPRLQMPGKAWTLFVETERINAVLAAEIDSNEIGHGWLPGYR